MLGETIVAYIVLFVYSVTPIPEKKHVLFSPLTIHKIITICEYLFGTVGLTATGRNSSTEVPFRNIISIPLTFDARGHKI